MDQFWNITLKFGMAALGIILVYNIITHGDAVVAELKAGGGFLTEESKILEGRG